MNGGNNKQVGFSTIGLIRNWFPWLFVIMIWLTVIGGMICGVMIGIELASATSIPHFASSSDPNFIAKVNAQDLREISYPILGGVIGLVGGFLVAVWVGGIIATFLKISENLQYLVDKEKAKD